MFQNCSDLFSYTLGCCTVQEGGHHGCQPPGVGHHSRGQICEGPLESGSPAASHKFSGALGRVSLSETFPPATQGSSCPGEDGQYDHSGVHKSPGGLALTSITHAGTQTDPVEQCASLVVEGNACPRDPEHGGGPPVQGGACVWW